MRVEISWSVTVHRDREVSGSIGSMDVDDPIASVVARTDHEVRDLEDPDDFADLFKIVSAAAECLASDDVAEILIEELETELEVGLTYETHMKLNPELYEDDE